MLAAVTVASDLNLGGFRLPSHTRQVNESWLDEFRSWVYGGGFGWQIGVGLATYVTTAAVYLMIAMAALTGDPLVAFLLMTGFGFVRGLAVLLGRRLTTPERLFALHRRLEELLPTAQRAIVARAGRRARHRRRRRVGPAPRPSRSAPPALVAALARRPRPATRPGAVVAA